MAERRFDVLVVGAGPAGSVAALVLARGGARVALVDKARFPRDKACGDLVGPRGVRLLDDLGVALEGRTPVGDMVVVGPSGRTVRLPCLPGVDYPDHALASPRTVLDATLRDAAVAAGAEPVIGRAAAPLGSDRTVEGFALSDGDHVRADVVIGADGATSRVADAAGLVDPARVLWGFALRAYVDAPVDQPHIVLWEPSPWRALPGYGWLFPGAERGANVGLGVGLLADRRGGAVVARCFDAFLGHLVGLGLLDPRPAPSGRLGGWLKLGMVGTTPARGRVLLVGDAAGLVNPLQGEGISQAMLSGRAAADAVLAGPGTAAGRYLDHLATRYAPYQAMTAAAHATLLPRRRTISAAGRLLTAPGVGRAVAGGWSVFWNDLLDGARPGPARALAAAVDRAGRVVTAPSRTRRRLARDLAPPAPR